MMIRIETLTLVSPWDEHGLTARRDGVINEILGIRIGQPMGRTWGWQHGETS